MKKKRVYVIVMLFACFSVNIQAQWKKKKAEEDTKIWRYDIECEGIAKQGSKLVKVWSYSKNPKHSIASGMRNAVHGIVFKGYAGGGRGCTSFQPLIKGGAIEEENEAFFNDFFKEGGEYLKYVSTATDGLIAPGDRLKISKREYKIGVVVNVMTEQLRKRLEAKGIIRGLSTGF